MFPGPCPTHNWAGSGRCQGPGRCLQITQGTSPWQRGERAQWAGRQAQSTHTNDRCSDASPSHLSTSQFSLLHLLACSFTKQRNSWRWQSCLLTPLSMITPKLPSLGWNSHSALHWLVVARFSNTHYFILTYFDGANKILHKCALFRTRRKDLRRSNI